MMGQSCGVEGGVGDRGAGRVVAYVMRLAAKAWKKSAMAVVKPVR